MLSMAQSLYIRPMRGLSCAAFAGLIVAGLMTTHGQERVPPIPRPPAPPREVLESAQADDRYLSDELLDGAYHRYDEPPPPPFEPPPTWAPCQSLRVNRSLVLGHLWFGMDILGWSTKGVHAPPIV